MSDRFYAQMGEHFKMSPMELKIAFWDEQSAEHDKLVRKAEGKKMVTTKDTTVAKKKKITRLDLNNMITEHLGVDIQAAKLPLPTLETILKVVKNKTYRGVNIPSGRLRAPYQEAMTESIGVEVDLSNTTVKTICLFLQAVNDRSARVVNGIEVP